MRLGKRFCYSIYNLHHLFISGRRRSGAAAAKLTAAHLGWRIAAALRGRIATDLTRRIAANLARRIAANLAAWIAANLRRGHLVKLDGAVGILESWSYTCPRGEHDVIPDGILLVVRVSHHCTIPVIQALNKKRIIFYTRLEPVHGHTEKSCKA